MATPPISRRRSRTDEGVTLFLVEADNEGVGRRRLETMIDRNTGRMTLTNVKFRMTSDRAAGGGWGR